MKQFSFLDLMFNLEKKTKPYRKYNSMPVYMNTSFNHLQIVFKQVSTSESHRL